MGFRVKNSCGKIRFLTKGVLNRNLECEFFKITAVPSSSQLFHPQSFSITAVPIPRTRTTVSLFQNHSCCSFFVIAFLSPSQLFPFHDTEVDDAVRDDAAPKKLYDKEQEEVADVKEPMRMMMMMMLMYVFRTFFLHEGRIEKKKK